MVRLLWLSDSPTCPTGLGTVSRHILKRLHATGRYQILSRGWGFRAGSVDPQEFPYEIQPATPDASDGPALSEALRSFRPDLFVTFGDLWNLDWLLRVPELNPARWIGYYPMDADPVLPQFTPLLDATGTVVAPSRFSAGVLSAAVPQKPVEVIYHGVDTRCFHPLPHRLVGPVERRSMGEFVVGFVGRNQPRKQIPVLLRAFGRFSQGREDAFLYLHTAARDCGWDLPALIEEYGLQEQSVISDRATALHGVSDAELNEIYNCMDVFVLPSTGEGFGLPILEAMAAGVPVVVTDSSASRELAGGRGELIRVASWSSASPGAPEIALPDEDHLLEILEKLYHNPRLRRHYSDCGRQFAQTLSWDSLAGQWETLFRRLLPA